MINIKRITFSFVALLVASSMALATTASAEMSPGPGGIPADDSSSSSSGSSDSDKETMGGKLLAEQLKTQAKLKLEAKKAELKHQTQEQRQKACTARAANLNKRMANAVTWATKHKGVIDSAYTRVKNFHDSKSLNVTNYSTLTATVDAAQAAAQVNITSLQTLDVSVDCTSQTVATNVSAFQDAVKNTRDSLKAYRKALVALIDSLKGASTGTHTDTSTNTKDQ